MCTGNPNCTCYRYEFDWYRLRRLILPVQDFTLCLNGYLPRSIHAFPFYRKKSPGPTKQNLYNTLIFLYALLRGKAPRCARILEIFNPFSIFLRIRNVRLRFIYFLSHRPSIPSCCTWPRVHIFQTLHQEHASCLCLYDIKNFPGFTKVFFPPVVNSDWGCSSVGNYLRIPQDALYKGRHT